MSAFTATHLAVSVSSSVEMCFVTAAPHTCQFAGGARRSDGEMRGGVRSRARGLPRGPRRRAGSPECGSGVGSRQLCDAGSVMHPSEPQRPRLAVTERTLAPGAGGAVSSQCRGNSDIVCAGKTPPPCAVAGRSRLPLPAAVFRFVVTVSRTAKAQTRAPLAIFRSVRGPRWVVSFPRLSRTGSRARASHPEGGLWAGTARPT